LGGAWLQNDTGRCLVVERVVNRDDCYGARAVHTFAEALARGSHHLNLFMRQSSSKLPLLFFDLETTGLNGGAGTYAFLVGCGWLEPDGDLATRQLLLTRFADARARRL